MFLEDLTVFSEENLFSPLQTKTIKNAKGTPNDNKKLQQKNMYHKKTFDTPLVYKETLGFPRTLVKKHCVKKIIQCFKDLRIFL